MKTLDTYLNEITVSYSKKQFTSTTIKTSANVQEVARQMFDHCNCQMELKEYFFIILLNRANHVIAYYKLSEGGISGTVVDLRIAFATAVKSLASGMILVHNHPSGNLKASEADINVTKKFVQAGSLLDITIFDHVILTTKGYYSFADEGQLF